MSKPPTPAMSSLNRRLGNAMQAGHLDTSDIVLITNCIAAALDFRRELPHEFQHQYGTIVSDMLTQLDNR